MRRETSPIFLLLLMLPMTASAFDHSYARFAKTLNASVRESGVDYKGLKADVKELEASIEQLRTATPTDYESWTDEQKIAFWINAYNATVLKIVVDNYPLESIKKLGPPVVGPWFKKFALLLGKERSLYEIENAILRKQFQEPRIHFALNCASASCPVLRAEPYLSAKLDQQLEEAGKKFLQDAKRNRLDRKAKVLHLSKIFDWFEKDFAAKGGAKAFASRSLSEADRAFLSQNEVVIKHLPYDWSLNDVR